MAQPVDVKHLLASGKQFTETGRSQARQLGTDLVSQGRAATEQIVARIDDLAGRASRERIEELRHAMRDEIRHELRTLRDSLNDELVRIAAAADRVAAVLNEVRSERDNELRDTVRDEVQRQLSVLGLATSEDVAALGRLLRDELSDSPAGKSEDNAPPDAPAHVTPPHQGSPTT